MNHLTFDTVPHVAPSHFVEHVLAREFIVDAPLEPVWAWLEDPKTFTSGNIWPYYVEFVSANDDPPGFYVGGINIHHGPFLNFAGMITEIREDEYRDLQYFYGSFFLSHRIVRPTRLQFWVTPHTEGQTKVKLQVDSLVAGWFKGIWHAGQTFFWGLFVSGMKRDFA